MSQPLKGRKRGPREKRAPEHYVNNAEFSQAVVDYVKQVEQAKQAGQTIPVVPDYIARCFVKIAEGLSHKSNFIHYTYREEMVMDAVENCLKAIENYNLDAATRTGKPNAFAYFTQISWYAFLRRIAKEKKQQDIKMRYMSSAGVDLFAVTSNTNAAVDQAATASVVNYVDSLRSRIEMVHDHDTALKNFLEEEKKRESARQVKLADGDANDS